MSLVRDRVVVLVDMDCFYCQVEENLNPKLNGKPLAVVQYNAWRGGGIIAVNYPARDRGVTRHMRGDEAKKKCPEIVLAQVPEVRGKADLTKYRDAGKLVANVLQTFTPLLERASVDEAYLDITEAVQQRKNIATSEIQLSQIKNTHVVGCDTMEFLYNLYCSGLCDDNNLNLAYGAVISEEIRAAVFQQTGYTCSAGIAHNKILAKLACGLNKPNKQTVLSQDNLQELFENLPVHKIRSLGGKFGHTLSEDLGISKMAELLQFSEKDLRKRYDEKTASWLFNIARGIDLEPVTTRLVSKSIGCCKKFPGKSALITTDSVIHWINELAAEIVERLEKDLEENNRKAKQMTVSYAQEVNGKDVSNSRVHFLNSYDAAKIADDSFNIIKKNCLKTNGVFCLKYLGISVGKFEDCRNVNAITSFFKVGTATTKINVVDTPEKEKANSSDTTIELNENSSDLKFFDESSNVSNDSIANELLHDDHSIKKESFFLRYFENLKSEQCETPVPRDFNTSQNLEDLEAEVNDDVLSCEPGTSKEAVDNTTEVCRECGETVLTSEMVSHMDYHFALQIQKEEKLINQCKLPVIVIKSKDGKRKKRKSSENVSNSLLSKFLTSDLQESDENSETCPHCNKKIPESDFPSHLDYHMAKKLHMEINPIKSCVRENITKGTTKSKAPKKNSNNTRSVISFFKPN